MRRLLILLLLLAAPARAEAPMPPATPEAAPETAPPAPEAPAPQATPTTPQATPTTPQATPPAPKVTLDIIPAGTHRLEEFRWLARPLVVFADSAADPRFVQQMEYINERPGDLIARDVVVIIDTAPRAESPIRTALRPRGFALVLIGKDGQIYLRRPLPQTVRELARSIDKMPIRQQELRAIRGLE